ncbi:MAG: DUF1016 N-terminal domain-containing protein, partial [Acidobacteriota bacterium]
MPTKKQSSKLLQKPAKKVEAKTSTDLLAGYEEFLSDLKQRIRSTQIKAAIAVNSELIALYWELGKRIVSKQEKTGWGEAFLDRLSEDLMREFPGVQGFSRRNLYRMRALYLAYRDAAEFVPQLVAQIPWGHNLVILEKIKDSVEREWYARQTLQY